MSLSRHDQPADADRRPDDRSAPGQDGDVEAQIHELDRAIERTRRRINWLRRGVIPTPETEAELAELEREYEALRGRFLELYRRWSQQP